MTDHSYLDARDNIINIANDGIYSVRCNFDYQIINNNLIYDFHVRGISVVDPEYSGVSPVITNNQIYSGLAYELTNGCRGPYAIFLENVSSQTTGQVELNEPISINGNCAGIRLLNCSNIGIQSNIIDYFTLSNRTGGRYVGYTGITLVGSNFCSIYSNSVNGFNVQDRNVQAFHGQSSLSNRYCCNNADLTNSGFEFNGNCNPTRLFTSNIGQHRWGVRVDNLGEIGLQVDFGNIGRGNRWMSAASLGGFNAFNDNGAGAITLRSKFIVGGCSSNFWPMSIIPNQMLCSNTPADWFNNTTIAGQACPNSNCIPIEFPPHLQSPGSGEIADIDLNDEFISRRTNDTTFSDWESKGNLMYRLLINPNLLGENSFVDSFYYASLGTNLEKYAIVEKNIKNALYINSEFHEALELNISSVLDGIINCQALDSLYALAVSKEDSIAINLQKIVIFAAKKINYQNAINIRDSSIRQNRMELDSVCIQNASLIPDNIFQQNQKEVNAIYLRTIARGIDTFTSSQTVILYNIANQCPYVGGRYVYFARSLYDKIEILEYNDTLLCQEPQPLILGTTNPILVVNKNSGVEIFPNPTSGNLNLLFTKKHDSNKMIIEVFNLVGKRLINETKLLLSTEKQLTLDVKEIPNGIYQLKISSGKETIHFQNIVIIK